MGETYTIGKGKVYFKPADIGGVPFAGGGWLHLGNSPDFKITPTIETKEHFSSTAGLQKKDKDIVTKISVVGGCTIDEPNINNLRLFALGAATVSTTQILMDKTFGGAGDDAPESFTTISGEWVKLVGYRITAKDAAGNPDGDPNTVEGVNLSADGTGTYYVEGIDYELDLAGGMIRMIPTADGGVMVDATEHFVIYSCAADVLKMVASGVATKFEGDLFFASNPSVGLITDVRGYVSIKPEGDLSLVGEDWMQFSLNLEFIENLGYTGLYELTERGQV